MLDINPDKPWSNSDIIMGICAEDRSGSTRWVMLLTFLCWFELGNIWSKLHLESSYADQWALQIEPLARTMWNGYESCIIIIIIFFKCRILTKAQEWINEYRLQILEPNKRQEEQERMQSKKGKNKCKVKKRKYLLIEINCAKAWDMTYISPEAWRKYLSSTRI